MHQGSKRSNKKEICGKFTRLLEMVFLDRKIEIFVVNFLRNFIFTQWFKRSVILFVHMIAKFHINNLNEEIYITSNHLRTKSRTP